MRNIFTPKSPEELRADWVRMFPSVMAITAVGLVAFAMSGFAPSPFDTYLRKGTEIATLWFAIQGYVYATWNWPLPRLGWLALVFLSLFPLIGLALWLFGPEGMDIVGLVIVGSWYIMWMLVALLFAGGVAGWMRYLADRWTTSDAR